jgi:hypothetical protein
MFVADKVLIRKVRVELLQRGVSCNSLAYCSRGKVFMLAEGVNISINALYLYRADQVVNVLKYLGGVSTFVYLLMISNNKHICLLYQII